MFGNPQDDELPGGSTQSTSTMSPSRASHATNVPLSIRANMRINLLTTTDDADHSEEDAEDKPMQPLLVPSTAAAAASLRPGGVRARKTRARRRRRLNASKDDKDDTKVRWWWRFCRSERAQSCFRFVWRLLQWTFIVVLVVGVFWYSYELHKNEYVLLLWLLLLWHNPVGEPPSDNSAFANTHTRKDGTHQDCVVQCRGLCITHISHIHVRHHHAFVALQPTIDANVHCTNLMDGPHLFDRIVVGNAFSQTSHLH